MANIAVQDVSGLINTITRTELDGADTLGAKTGDLYIQNEDVGSHTINIDGDGASATHTCEGAGQKDLTNGFDITVPAGNTVKVELRKISSYLVGTVAVTGAPANGVFAWIE